MHLAKCQPSSCRKLAFESARLARSRQVTEPRRPESVLVIVYTDDGDILLLQRSAPFEFWQSVTGSLTAVETPANAARRELFEETGLIAEGAMADKQRNRTFSIDPRWRDRYAAGVCENIEYEWHYRLGNVTDITIDETEHRGFRWVSIDDAINSVWSWTNKEALIALRTELRQSQQPV